ncbi:cytochrome c biogenesis heme-transporting ATPase CcmA [Pelomicrobium methylotrophicum]|uniref:Cytochrome c biogenesis heme-transporting ATPase CcmA n=1 Tax=Pelomicrobium methylotrophicum TaxID=2602750 RepID=A0A5C7ET95_9PROT|nr:cytochrome c biogenesis heme-transporting ATPase CcmA [Pelomicrobium methylotrophicum]TXF11129.1 cytochrome c biogenesis heme-transporting ATPase CcmA [Pelomicrobium methylotrophicum]
MLSATHLTCVRGDQEIFRGVSFELAPGSLLQVAGPNGSGKTSLLRILCGLLAPESGEVRWAGEPIRDLGDEYFSKLHYVGHLNGIKDELSALENLRIFAGLSGEPIEEGRAADALRRMGLGGREDFPVKRLSQGQKRRVALARLAMADRPLWILDEPFAALDAEAVAIVQALVEEHLERGGLAVLTTHQAAEIRCAQAQRLQLAG